MGNISPKFIVDEKTKWAIDHALGVDVATQQRQHQLLRNFGETLLLCYVRCKRCGFEYKHYFVTDLTWTIEFLEGGIKVHSDMLPDSYREESRFRRTESVTQRMQLVCGATQYAVTLRNCEQVARYIENGAWISYQMVEGAFFGAQFVEYMMNDTKKRLNILPQELRNLDALPRGPLVCNHPGFLTYIGSPQGVSLADQDAFNVLVLGPSGCGKSRLINMLFNQNVSRSSASAFGVTREIKILSGRGQIGEEHRRVNVIDTIGLCDSHISAHIVLDLIKNSLRVNFAYIDEVIVICSDRIQEMHSQNIKQMIEWLKYTDFPHNFTFIYNKADGLTNALREENVACMCEVLGAKRNTLRLEPGQEVNGDRFRGETSLQAERHHLVLQRVFATGFPPAATDFQDVREDFAKVVDSAFSEYEGFRRLPVQESWCSIL